MTYKVTRIQQKYALDPGVGEGMYVFCSTWRQTLISCKMMKGKWKLCFPATLSWLSGLGLKKNIKKKKFCDVFLIDFSVGYSLTLLSFSFHQKNEWWVGTKQKHSVCVQFTLCFDKQRSIQGKFLRAVLFKLNLLTTVLNVNTILLYIFYLEKYVLINLLLMKCNCQFLNLFILFCISDIFKVWESCQVSDLIWPAIFVAFILNI